MVPVHLEPVRLELLNPVALTADLRGSSVRQILGLHGGRVAILAEVQAIASSGVAVGLHVLGTRSVARFARDAELGDLGVEAVGRLEPGSAVSRVAAHALLGPVARILEEEPGRRREEAGVQGNPLALLDQVHERHRDQPALVPDDAPVHLQVM